MLHDLSQIDHFTGLNGFEDRIADGDRTESIFGIRQDVIRTILQNAEEHIFLDQRIAAAMSADTRFDPETFPGPEDGEIINITSEKSRNFLKKAFFLT